MNFKIIKLKNKSNTYNLVGNDNRNFCQIQIFPKKKEYRLRQNLLYKSTSNDEEEMKFINEFLMERGFDIL